MFVEDLKKSFLQSLVWIGPEVSEEVIQMWSVNNGDGGDGLQVNNGAQNVLLIIPVPKDYVNYCYYFVFAVCHHC
jgi:hypothetical protein